MDRNEREKLKQEKLLIVHQKAYRKKLIETKCPDISDFDYLLYPESQSIINRFREVSVILGGYTSKLDSLPANLEPCHTYKELSWEEQVVDIINNFSNIYDSTKAYLWFLEVKSPVFITTFDWVRNSFGRLWSERNIGGTTIGHDLCVVSEDFTVGIVVSHYGGYLMSDPNPREIVYEVETWNNE